MFMEAIAYITSANIATVGAEVLDGSSISRPLPRREGRPLLILL